MTAPTESFGPVELEVLKRRLECIADEICLTVVRTARSTIVRDSLDFSAGLMSAEGELVAQSATMPFHLGAMPDAVDTLRRRYAGELAPGDIYVLNDPFDGGMHLPDIFMIKPVFTDQTLIGFSVVVVHHTDVGGPSPGSNAADGAEIYAEGLRIPLTRWSDRDGRDETLIKLIRTNVRVPDIVIADIMAQEAAVFAGDRELRAVAEGYGAERLIMGFAELTSYTERVTRAAIEELPDGAWEFEDYIDSSGPGTDPVVIHVRLQISGDSVLVDLTGSSPQVRAGLNCSYSFAKSCVYLTVRSVIGGVIPNNAGFFRPISVIAPPGTVVNHSFPAACAARGLTGFRLVDALFGAFAQALPQRIPAAGDGGNTFVSLGGYDDAGNPYVWVEAIVGSWGGRPRLDGLDGNAPLAANIRNAPVEIVEKAYPVRIQEYGLVTDTGGPGEHRGGLAIARRWQLLEGRGTLQVRADRHKLRPWGLAGGSSGTPSANLVGTEEVPALFIREMHAGDTFHHVIASGGGHGDPFARDVVAVLRDVVEDKVSVAFAREQYGVVIGGRVGHLAIDEEATEMLRAARSRHAEGARA
jgi:N-methylhydantoinase B